VNCIYVNPETEQFWIIDYRIFDPEKDGKTKVTHVTEMLKNLVNHKQLSFGTVLMDSWYATYKLMLFIHVLKKRFYCPIKKNRTLRLLEKGQSYHKVSELFNEDFQQGQLVQLRGMPKVIALKLFSISVSTHRIDYIVTNDLTQSCPDDTKRVCAIRWYIEQFHRELKQLTGVENCQCRKQRIQRNHIACAIHVWLFLKRLAYKTASTVYQIKKNLMREYLMDELKNPSLKFGFA
jgi:hypothetical protein